MFTLLPKGLFTTLLFFAVMYSAYPQNAMEDNKLGNQLPLVLLKNGTHFNLHIQDSILDRDIIAFSRVLSASGSISTEDLDYSGSRGGKLLENILQIRRSNEDSIALYLMDYGPTAFSSVSRSISSTSEFEKKARFKSTASGNAIIVDVTSLIAENNDLIYLAKNRLFKLGAKEFKETYLKINQIINTNSSIEILSEISINSQAVLNVITSIVLLPKEPMRPRWKLFPINYYTQKIGVGLDNKSKVKGEALIKRRLEPWPADIDKYNKGQLVVPQKPIIFVIDPNTPTQIVPYVKKAVENWNVAFEKIGFKNAIQAKELNAGDINRSLIYSSHYSMIYYVNSKLRGSAYSTIIDPRSGEILQSSVLYSSGSTDLAGEMYFARASAIDKRARSFPVNEDLIGSLIEKIVSHEVGHSLGFTHNYIASNSVPSSKLRDQTYLIKHGCSPSIMDYARYNYVGQPSDELSTEKAFIWRIGDYDKWGIKVGYYYFEPKLSDRKIQQTISSWKNNNGTKLIYRSSDGDTDNDPRAAAESFGADPLYSSEMGMRNIQLINDSSICWIDPSEIKNRSFLAGCYQELMTQYYLLIDHVAVTILGSLRDYFSKDYQKYKLVSEIKQRKGIDFLQKYCFHYPEWLFKNGLGAVINVSADSSMAILQSLTLERIFSFSNFEKNLLSPNGSDVLCKVLKALREALWEEIYTNVEVDNSRKNLQKIYINALSYLQEQLSLSGSSAEIKLKIRNAINSEISDLTFDLSKAVKNYPNKSPMFEYLQKCNLELSEMRN